MAQSDSGGKFLEIYDHITRGRRARDQAAPLFFSWQICTAVDLIELRLGFILPEASGAGWPRVTFARRGGAAGLGWQSDGFRKRRAACSCWAEWQKCGALPRLQAPTRGGHARSSLASLCARPDRGSTIASASEPGAATSGRFVASRRA